MAGHGIEGVELAIPETLIDDTVRDGGRGACITAFCRHPDRRTHLRSAPVRSVGPEVGMATRGCVARASVDQAGGHRRAVIARAPLRRRSPENLARLGV